MMDFSTLVSHLHFAGFLQSLIFGSYIVIRTGRKFIYFSLFLFVYSFPLLSYLLKASCIFELCPQLIFLPELFFGSCPLLYVFIISLYQRLDYRMVIHLLPLAAEVLVFGCLLSLPYHQAQAFYIQHSSWFDFVFGYGLTMFSLTYLFVIQFRLYNKRINFLSGYSYLKRSNLMYSVWLLIVVYIFHLLSLGVYTSNRSRLVFSFIDAILSASFIYFISITMLKKAFKLTYKDAGSEVQQRQKNPIDNKADDWQVLESNFLEIELVLINSEIYLNPDLNLHEAAAYLNLPPPQTFYACKQIADDKF